MPQNLTENDKVLKFFLVPKESSCLYTHDNVYMSKFNNILYQLAKNINMGLQYQSLIVIYPCDWLDAVLKITLAHIY